MSLDLATIGISMDTSGLEKGTTALRNTEQAANKTADAADKTSKRFLEFGSSSDKARSATEKLIEKINIQVKAIEEQAKTFGMSASQAAVYKLAIDGATDSQIKQASAAMKSVESLKQARELGESIGNAIKFASVALAGFALAGVYAFEKLIGNVAKYRDLAEQTGGDPAGLASLRTAADVGGVSVDALSMAANRLEKNLSRVDDESKGAGKALAAIGIDLDSFKNLTADEKLRSLGKALNQYEDSGTKVAVIQDIMGRGAAQYLSALKELGNEQGKVNKLTNDQIIAADDYKDAQARVRSELSQTIEVLAVDALPIVTEFIKALKDTAKELFNIGDESKKLTGADGIREYATSGAVLLAHLADGAYAVGQMFNYMGNNIGATAAQAAALARLDFSGAGAIGRASVDFNEKLSFSLGFADKLSARLDALNAKSTYGMKLGEMDNGWENGKPKLDYSAVKDPKEKASNANGERKAQLAYDLDQYKKYSEAIVNTYGNSEKIMEAMRANGLVDEAQYYASKFAFVRLNSEQKQSALEQEIARMQQEKFVGTNAVTEKLNNDRKISDSQAKIEKIKEDALATTRIIEIQQTAAINKTAQAYRDAEDAAKSYLDSLQRAQGRELGGMGLGTQERGRLAGRGQIEDKYDQDRRSLEKIKRDAMASGTFGDDAQKKYDDELERIDRFNAAALSSFDKNTQDKLEKERNFQTGASEAMNNYLADVGNVAKQSENLFTKAFKGMEDALVGFVKTGKLDFASLADSIISDLIRMQIQQSITKPLGEAMKGGDLLGGIGKIFGFADGGDPPVGVPSMVGERGPELFVPRTAGTIIPNNKLGSGDSNVTVNQTFEINAPNATGEVIGQIRSIMPALLAENKRAVVGIIQQAAIGRGGRLAA